MNSLIEMPVPYSFIYLKLFYNLFILGKDAKRSILLKSEECQTEIEYAFYRENVAKKYAKFFQSTLHHNNGYFLQVLSVFTLVFVQCIFSYLSRFIKLIYLFHFSSSSVRCSTSWSISQTFTSQTLFSEVVSCDMVLGC